MDESPLFLNPIEPDEAEIALPFAGRNAAFSALNQHLSDPVNTECVTFLGRRRIGKSTVLRQFAHQTAASFLAVYVPLRQVTLHNEGEWLQVLSRAIVNTASSQGFTVAEMAAPPDEPDSLRDWLSGQCIPAVMRAIRHRKRIVLLLDDLDALIDASGELVVPPHSFAFLHGLRQPNMGIAAAIDLAFEGKLQLFSPLVNVGQIHRLTRLTPQATSLLLHDPNSKLNTVAPDAIEIIFRETGGEPSLAQHFVACFSGTHRETIKQDDVRSALPVVYVKGSADLSLLWSLLNVEEQRVLSAISTLKYRNPLRPVDTNAIESWLVRTDYPTDTTSINSALRSMEYYGIVEGSTTNIIISAGLMHKWLLENADFDSEVVVIMPGSRKRFLLGLAVVLIFLIVLFVILSSGTRPQRSATPVPTVPLANPE